MAASTTVFQPSAEAKLKVAVRSAKTALQSLLNNMVPSNRTEKSLYDTIKKAVNASERKLFDEAQAILLNVEQAANSIEVCDTESETLHNALSRVFSRLNTARNAQ